MTSNRCDSELPPRRPRWVAWGWRVLWITALLVEVGMAIKRGHR